jgi:hypothetical protein
MTIEDTTDLEAEVKKDPEDIRWCVHLKIKKKKTKKKKHTQL